MNPNNTIYGRAPRGFSPVIPTEPGWYAAWQSEGRWPCDGRVRLVEVIRREDGLLSACASNGDKGFVDELLTPEDGFQSDEDPWFEAQWSLAIDPAALAPQDPSRAGADIDWIDCRRQMPTPPDTPYEVYLCWVVQLSKHATGCPQLAQYSRDRGGWMPLPFGPAGVPQVVTHYSRALQVLGAPGPHLSGPCGADYM